MDNMTLSETSRRLLSGQASSRELVEQCLERIEDEAGEGKRVFISVDADSARAQADAIDAARAQGAALPPLAGIPVSIKDLFDIEGQVTSAGSVVLRDAPPAARDAGAVRRLRAAGMVLLGRTNMTEFAFSGLGLNPHYGTPRNPWQREQGRIPGGSSSGAAISVTDGMAYAALGTDTGGSCRIPAALTGLVGFKPTAALVPKDGALPLSQTLDSVGGMAHTVACCEAFHAVLAGRPVPRFAACAELASARFLVPSNYVLEGMDAGVATAFEAMLRRIRDAGAILIERPLAPLDDLAHYNRKGGFTAAEGYHIHAKWLAAHGEAYDPRVRSRLLRGQEQSADDYLELIEQRAHFIAQVDDALGEVDGMLFPTTPAVAPLISEVGANDDIYGKTNLLMLRNSTVVNFLDGCAVSVPMHAPGSAPVGLTIAGAAHTDASVFQLAGALEKLRPLS